jgi:3-ketosteroid 9alpha-monooxygenase subunit B
LTAQAEPTDPTLPAVLRIRLGQTWTDAPYHAGDTVLETARRSGLNPPFSCEQGNCATCIAHLDEGTVRMRNNNALAADEVADGWILSCQSVPTSDSIVVDYDA